MSPRDPYKKTVNLRAKMTKVKMLMLKKNGDYQIGELLALTIKYNDGSTGLSFPDTFDAEDGGEYQLLRVDRANKTIVYREKGYVG